MYLHVLEYNPDHVERTYFPGDHGDRINGADFANTQLNWLSQFTRRVGDAPQNLNFSLDWTGSHFWITAAFSETSLTEAHWLRVQNATYSQRLQTIDLDVENLKPLTGGSVAAPRNLPVTLTFDLQRIGLPTIGTYTVERVGKDDGTFSQTFVTASGGKIQTTVPQGAYILRLSAGGQPPSTKTLSLRQGEGGYTGVTDTYITPWYPDTNYATAASLQLRVDGTNPIHTGLLRFDLSKLPADAKVRFAVLNVKVISFANYPLPLQVDSVTRAWKVNEATWTRASAALGWAAPGASNVPGDRAGLIPDTRTVYPTADVTDRYGLDVTDIVRGWAEAPSSNQGFQLRVQLLDGAWGTAKDGFSVASSDYGAVSWRPQLMIAYTQDPLTPTPSNTPTTTATPTNTATPTATPTATATPRDGQVAGLVFQDANRNGRADAGESGVGSLIVRLKRDSAIYANVATDPTGHYNFDSVSPGNWQIALDITNYSITTAWGNPAAVSVSSGATTTVDFGIAPATPTVTPTPTAGPSPTPTATRTPCTPGACTRQYLPLLMQGVGQATGG